jgi:hypothetical protein
MKKIWARDLLSFFLMILCFNSLECKKGKKWSIPPETK